MCKNASFWYLIRPVELISYSQRMPLCPLWEWICLVRAFLFFFCCFRACSDFTECSKRQRGEAEKRGRGDSEEEKDRHWLLKLSLFSSHSHCQVGQCDRLDWFLFCGVFVQALAEQVPRWIHLFDKAYTNAEWIACLILCGEPRIIHLPTTRERITKSAKTSPPKKAKKPTMKFA